MAEISQLGGFRVHIFPHRRSMSFTGRTTRSRLRCAASRRAFSLVEMIAATALVAGTLAPALAVMRDAMAISRESTRRNLLAVYAVQALEYASGVTMQGWATGTSLGNFASEGHPAIRYVVTRSDAPANGGITGLLMHVQVTMFDDVNGNTALDANEVSVRFRTKVAKLLTYQNEPN
jgi:type II secretory pathway pseudopilin PulG